MGFLPKDLPPRPLPRHLQGKEEEAHLASQEEAGQQDTFLMVNHLTAAQEEEE